MARSRHVERLIKLDEAEADARCEAQFDEAGSETIPSRRGDAKVHNTR